MFWWMDPFEKGHSGPVGAKVSECSQLESLYAVSYLFQVGVQSQFKCFGGFMGYATFVCDCVWGQLDCWLGYFTSLGSWETLGEVCYFLLHVSKCISIRHRTFVQANLCQSNSLPIAIVSSLAYTLDKDLYWDKIKKDSAEQVVSRGILYLLIFAQYPTCQ